MGLNDAGKIAIKFWLEIPEHFSHVDLDEFIVMPNHIHGIIVIKNNVMENVNVVGAKDFSPLQQQPSKFHSPSKTIGSIVRGFKIGVTKWFRNHTDIYNVWQRNYWDHIIRNENELNRIRQYIIDNPKKWDNDRYFG